MTAAGSLLDAGSKLDALALGPDGRRLACAADAGALRLWNLPDPRPQTTLVGHTAALRALAFDPTGELLASAGLDQTICLWSLAGDATPTKDEPRRLRGHGDWISTLAFAPHTKGTSTLLLASGSGDGTARLWRLARGEGAGGDKESLVLSRGAQLVRAVAFGPDGKRLAVARLSGPIELWDVGARSPVGQADLGAGFGPIRFSPSGALLASSGDKRLRLWSLSLSRVVAGSHSTASWPTSASAPTGACCSQPSPTAPCGSTRSKAPPRRWRYERSDATPRIAAPPGSSPPVVMGASS